MQLLVKRKCSSIMDNRGKLVQVISHNMLNSLGLTFGQVYFVSFSEIGVMRGNHYHLMQSETFFILEGVVELSLQHIETGEKHIEIISAEQEDLYSFTFGPKVLHTMVSHSPKALLLAHSDKVYDPCNEDKYYL